MHRNSPTPQSPTAQSPGPRVAVYDRVARAPSDLPREEVLAECQAYAERKFGVAQPTVFTDHGRSGRDPARPGFAALMDAVGSGLLDIVVFPELARLARDPTQFATIMLRMNEARVHLHHLADEDPVRTSDLAKPGKIVGSVTAGTKSGRKARRGPA